MACTASVRLDASYYFMAWMEMDVGGIIGIILRYYHGHFLADSVIFIFFPSLLYL